MAKMIPDGGCTVTLDEAATLENGGRFEIDSDSRIRVELYSELVFRIEPESGYRITEVVSQNCTAAHTGGGIYRVYNISGASSITVNTEKVLQTEQAENEAESELKPAAPSKNEKLIAGVQKTTVKLYKPAIVKSSKSKSGKAIKLRWKKSAGYKVDYYQLVRTMKKADTYKKTYTIKSNRTTYTNYAGLKNKNTYYYKIRGARKIDGKLYYTKWSTRRSIVFRA